MDKINIKTVDGFNYRNSHYPVGTKFIYSGLCKLSEENIKLTNQECEFLYSKNYKEVYFKANDIVYVDDYFQFPCKIVKIVPPLKEVEKEEFYFTDDMVVNTVWYIIIMLVAVIFHGRILIWIFATLVYYNSTFRKK